MTSLLQLGRAAAESRSRRAEAAGAGSRCRAGGEAPRGARARGGGAGGAVKQRRCTKPVGRPPTKRVRARMAVGADGAVKLTLRCTKPHRRRVARRACSEVGEALGGEAPRPAAQRRRQAEAEMDEARGCEAADGGLGSGGWRRG